MDHDDLDEDIERLKIILQDEEGEEEGDSDGELRVLENNEEEYYSNASRPSTSSDVTASSFPTTSVCTDADDAVFRFDPNTITAETCLAMNRAYQEVLLDTLRQIEISLMENRNRQKELEENVDEKVKKTDKQTNKEFYDLDCRHMPYFKDKDGQVPPYNDDVKQKEQMNEEKQHVKPKTIWSKKQRKMLMDAIKLDALEQAVRPLLNKQEVEMEKLGRCKNTEEIQETKARIEKIQQEIKQKQETPADELLKSCDNKKIDFLKIAVITFGNKFSVTECESMWNTVLRPGINRDKWTPAEEEDLNRLAIKYEMRNWSKIAEELGSNRTPFQCLQHYQQHNIVYDNSEWTEEEDELLKEVVETCTYGLGRVKWFQVAYYIDRRSPDQCHSRWNKIDPNRTYGRWSKEEDLQLVNAIHIHGGVADWNKIKELVPTRSAVQCRERFVYRLSGDVLFKPWTYEDDKKLLQLHQIHGSNWTRIAMEFEGRNDNMLLVRYKRLMKWQQLSEGFYSQSKKVQKQLKHPAFKFGSGAIVPKSGLKLRWGKPGHPKKGETLHVRRRHKTEIEKLKEIGGRDAKDSDDDNDDDDIKEEEEEDVEEEEEEDNGKTRSLREMQDSLDAFLVLYNIQAYDYYKQIADRELGNLVVPRPPPIRRQKMNVGQALWKKQDKLQDVVATQIDAYIRNIQTKLQDETSESSPTDLNLYDQISKNIKKGNEEEKRRMINAAFGGKNPCNLSVRELLNISKCIKDHGRPPKNPKRYNMEPWEVAESEEEEPEDEESSEFELEQEEEEEKPKEKRPRSEKQIAHAQAWKLDVRKHHAIKAQIKRLVQSKMDPKELNKGRGRRKQFLMYPKHVLMKYKGFEEERRLNRKSLVLLMKTLDLDSKKAFFKAKKGKRKVSAMALLKATEKANLKRAKTRRQKTEIQEAARTEANMNSEISEVSDYLLELRDELKVEDNESDENMSVDESGADEEDNQGSLTFGYNKSLPYIPPNKTNILGMRSLLLEHRYLIDEAGMYFNPEDLKEKLYRLKQRGPNPLMGVLNAIGKTENAARRREKEKKGKSELTHVVCKKQLDRVRRTTDYQKLQARFHSVFTWPALLATIQPPKGKPIPLSLQTLIEQSKLKEGQVNAEPSDEAVVQAESVTEDDMEGLSEEQAVEKLVDKIMEEYEKERGKKKRHLPTKKYRHFSEKRKQGLKDKERTKILKRLGLYEKMQEFKRRRLEGEQTTPVSDAAATAESTASIIRSATETETEENSADNISTASLPVHSTNDTELNASSETAAPVMNSSEGCQVDFPPDDFGMTDAVVKTEVLPKRKRGRPPGSKTKCFTDKSPVRKSRRAADSPNVIVKLEQDYELSPPKKKTQSTKRRTQYNFVRTLIPDKMSKIASQIPEIPILNEPIPEKTLKPPKKPKVEKPVKQIFRSKFAQELAAKKKKREKGEFDKRGPKSGRILKQLKEAEAVPAETEKEAAPAEAEKDAALPTYVQIKTEPLDSDDEDYTANMNKYNGTVTAQDSVNNLNKAEKTSRKETKMPVSKVVTSRLKQSLQRGKGMLTKVFDKNLNSVTTQNQGITQEQKDIKNISADINDKQCAIDVTPETEMVQSQKLQSQNIQSQKLQSQNVQSQNVQSQNVQSQNENKQISNGPEGRKPLIIAVPVTIGGTQQVACVPFYPDEEGKITLPNGKKIDASGAGQQGAVSLPMLNFDQPLQILDPSQPSVNTDSAKDQTSASLLNQSTSVLNQGASELNQGASVPNSDATNASSKTN